MNTPLHEPTPAPIARASRWRDGMLWLLGGIVALVLGTNGVMIAIAVRTHPDLVRSDYYEASKRVDAAQAAQAASARLGWRVHAVTQGQPRGALLLRVEGADGRPVEGLTGTVRAYRPADARLDQTLSLQADATDAGTYGIELGRTAPGLWRLALELRRPDDPTARYVDELRVVLP